MAPEHKRLACYGTMTLADIMSLPVSEASAEVVHLYLWVPIKSNVVWHNIRKDGSSDGRGVGFYFRNVTEMLLFGVREKNARTLASCQRQLNMIETRKREHSRKRDERYTLIEPCSPGRYFELNRLVHPSRRQLPT